MAGVVQDMRTRSKLALAAVLSLVLFLFLAPTMRTYPQTSCPPSSDCLTQLQGLPASYGSVTYSMFGVGGLLTGGSYSVVGL